MRNSKTLEIWLLVGLVIGGMIASVDLIINKEKTTLYVTLIGNLITLVFWIVLISYLWIVNNQFALFFEE